MENNTTAREVIDFFESSFVDKKEIPYSLEIVWLRKAVGKYSNELDQLDYDEEIAKFNCKLDDYVISTLAQFMTQYYQERQVSLANKRISIVGKDISIDGSNGSKTAERNHLEYISREAREMVENQKPTAFI